jgi:hypothetical protein
MAGLPQRRDEDRGIGADVSQRDRVDALERRALTAFE